MNSAVILYPLKLIVLFILYFITAEGSLRLNAVSNFAAPVWFPAGISLVALFFGGYRLWPSIFLGALSVNFFLGSPFFSALGIGLGNTLEAIVGVLILRRMGFGHSLERARDVIALTLVAGPVSAFFSATIGVISLWQGQMLTDNAVFITWSAWWIGDTLSDMIIAPFLFIWATKFVLEEKDRKKIVEGILLAIIILLFSVYILERPSGNPPGAYVIFPPLIWAAFRFNPRFVITAVFSFFLLAIWDVAHGIGTFVREDLSQSFLRLQVYMGVVSVSTFIFAAVIAERNRLERRKDDFINMASHELRTPVTTIKIYLHILMSRLKKYNDKKSLHMLEGIDKQTDQLKELVSDLLDVTSIQTKKLQFKMNEFRLDELVEEIRNGLQYNTKKHKILYEGKSPVVIYGDSFRISQVITNLLMNSIKYTPKGGSISIKITKEKEQVVLSVKDSGIGISEDEHEKIFERLYQANDTLHVKEKTYPGLGMGLYISKEIIRRHGGRIWVKSKQGKGSTFSFALPYH